MREIVLKEAMNVGFRGAISHGSMFVTPEHLLLPFLVDSQVCLMLAGIEVDPKGFTNLVIEHVAAVPTWEGKRRPPVQSLAIDRIFARLRAKELELRSPLTVYGRHFIEAYAYDAQMDGDVEPPMSALLLAQRHREIELAVYGKLPGT